jgi:hypothetical protein
MPKTKTRRRQLPRGIVQRGRDLILDASVGVVRISHNLVLFVRVPTKGGSAARRASDPIGWGACGCDKSGRCKPKITMLPDGQKFTFSCVPDGCTGSCSLAGGTFPRKRSRRLVASMSRSRYSVALRHTAGIGLRAVL